jgi:hypothetical protein
MSPSTRRPRMRSLFCTTSSYDQRSKWLSIEPRSRSRKSGLMSAS